MMMTTVSAAIVIPDRLRGDNPASYMTMTMHRQVALQERVCDSLTFVDNLGNQSCDTFCCKREDQNRAQNVRTQSRDTRSEMLVFDMSIGPSLTLMNLGIKTFQKNH